MKIERRKISHWILLVALAGQGLAGIALRFFMNKHLVVLYGHKLNGNLLAIYKKMPNTTFLTMDRTYCSQLKRQGVRCEWACSPKGGTTLARAKAIISDHGLHSLEPLIRIYKKTGVKFFDVWHGIPFKGFDGKDFRLQQQYDEIWVASNLHKDLYVDYYDFDEKKVVPTGYARTDTLLAPIKTSGEIRRELGLPEDCQMILFAPTWAQDSKGRNLYPFGTNEAEFLGSLSTLVQKSNACILLRTHLNTDHQTLIEHDNIFSIPSDKYPDTESILQISDILICDWSSICFDYLLLDRPTFFLDVAAPFQKGFSLGPEYRFGEIIKDMNQLLPSLDNTLKNEEQYWKKHAANHKKIRSLVYGPFADGRSTARCIERLLIHVQSKNGFSQ